MSQRALRKKDQMQHTYKQHYYQHHRQSNRRADHAIDANGNLNATNDKFGSTPNLVDTNENCSTLADASVSMVNVENSLTTKDSSRSESDLTRLRDETTLVNAKSEFHLKSIASTRVVPQQSSHYNNGIRRDSETKSAINESSPQSKVSTRSAPSQMTSCSISSTASDSVRVPPRSPSIGFADTSTIRVPIIGYEVMEERARFTVHFTASNVI